MKTQHLLLIVLLLAFVRPVQGQDVASDLLGRINGLRANLGLHPYALNGPLTAAAQNQATWMVQTGQISHFQPDGSRPRDRAVAAGYPSSWVSENIYMGTRATAESAFNWWINSPIHYQGLTSDHYYDIGIASASANGSTAFVLVFGNPNTTVRVAPPAAPAGAASGDSSSSASAAVPGLPPFVIGLDDDGSILHEVQAGQTLGEIALIYGYDWPDLQMIRDWNDLTEAEGRSLDIGQVLRIPPWEGTYTPEPEAPPVEAAAAAAESTADLTPPPAATFTPTGSTAAPPTPRATITATPSVTPTPGPTDTPTLAAGQGVVWVAVTVTPTPGPTSTPMPNPTATSSASPTTGPSLTPAAVAQAGPPAGSELVEVIAPTAAPSSGGGDSPSPVLLMLVAVQVIVVVGAGFELWRRQGRVR